MPVVGEAHIIVRAITTNVAKDIKNGFNGVGGSGGKSATAAGQTLSDKFMKGFNKNLNSSGFSKFTSGIAEALNIDMKQSADTINALVVQGYKGTTMAGIFAGAIGTLIGSLISLVGAAGGAAASFTAIIGLMMSVKVATAVAKMAFNGIGEAVGAATEKQKTAKQTLRELREELQQLKFDAEEAALSEEEAAINLEKAREGLARMADLPVNDRSRREAELAYKQAELNYRRAKDRSRDLNEELKTGAKAKAKARANDPYADLTESQKEFAKYLVKLQPILKNLREAVANGFLKTLTDGLNRILTSKSFDAIYGGIKKVGDALGDAVRPVMDFIASAEGAQLLNNLFQMFADTTKALGPIIAKFARAFLKVMSASAPITQRLVGFIDRLLDNFNNLLDSVGDAGLVKFFTMAADIAGKFGKILGNVFNGLMGIIEANFGPGTGGDYLLNWLIEATSGFGEFGKGSSTIKQFFLGIAVNAKKMLSGFSGIINALLSIAAQPEIGFFFDEIKKAAPFFSSILQKANKSLPTVGKLFVKIIEIIDKLTDSGAVDNFFNGLLMGAEWFSKLMDNKVVQSVTTVTGRIHAWVLSFKEMSKYAAPVLGFMMNNVTKVADAFTKTKEVIGNVETAMGVLGQEMSFDGIKKTVESFKNAGQFLNLSAANQARSFMKGSKGQFIDSPSKSIRKMVSSNNFLIRGLGKTRLAASSTALQFKLMQASAITGFDKMAASNNKFVSNFGKAGAAIAKHPIILIVSIIIGLFAIMYTKNEKFRNMIDSIMKPALDTLGDLFHNIMVAIQPLILEFQRLMGVLFGSDGQGPLVTFFKLLAEVIARLIIMLAPLIQQMVEMLVPIIEKLMKLLIPIVELFMAITTTIIQALMPVIGLIFMLLEALLPVIMNVVQTLMNMLMPILDAVIAVITPILEIFTNLITLVGAFFEALMTGDWDKFADIAKKALHGIVQGLANLLTGLVNLIIQGLNLAMQLFFSFGIGWAINEAIKLLTGGGVDLSKGNLITWRMPELVVPAFAEGGVVSPSSGGTLGLIAEAGRPERIEPLDSKGLSDRDYAMIQALGGGGGMNINIHASPGMDVDSLAAQVSRKIAFQMRKGSTA